MTKTSLNIINMETGKNLIQRNGFCLSIQESLNEKHCFIPNAPFIVRKTNSMDDISRFYRYFDLIESNSETLITWKTYVGILQDQLYSYETQKITSENGTHEIQDPASQERMLPSVKKKIRKSKDSSRVNRGKMASFNKTVIIEDCGKVNGDTFIMETSADENFSDTSDRSDISIITRARLLRSICTETKILAEKICKTVERISRLPKRLCPLCGESIRGSRHNKQCYRDSEVIGDTFIIEPIENKKLKKNKTQGGSKDSSYFSLKSSTPEGESTGRSRFKKFNPLKKSSMKRLTYLFVKH